MGDVGERPGVDEGRPALERLEQVRLDGVAQEDRHRAGDVEVLGGDRRPVGRGRQDDAAESGAQVEQVRGKSEDGHHLGADGDDVLGLARDPVLAPAEADDDVAQGAIADVDDARPEDPVRVDAERVLVVEAVVEERAGEIVRGPDGMDVAGQVEVEVLHRDDLAVAAAGRSALDPEDRPERRLADVDRGLLPDDVEALGEPDRGRRLALAERRRGDRGHDHVLAARTLGLEPCDRLERHLRLGRPVELELVVGDPEVAGDVDDRARLDRTGDLEVGREAHRSPRSAADGSAGAGSSSGVSARRSSAWRSAARIRWVSRAHS